MNKVTLGLGVATVAAGMLFASQTALANNYQNGRGNSPMLERKAQALNITQEELQTQLQTKTMAQIAQDKGLSLEQWKQKMTEFARQRWQEMGLSQEEIAEREEWRSQRQANCDGSGVNRGTGGYGRQVGGRGMGKAQ